jgi:hypothetical protein
MIDIVSPTFQSALGWNKSSSFSGCSSARMHGRPLVYDGKSARISVNFPDGGIHTVDVGAQNHDVRRR